VVTGAASIVEVRASPESGMNEEVQRFVDAVPEDLRPLFDSLRLLVERLYPDATLVLSHGDLCRLPFDGAPRR